MVYILGFMTKASALSGFKLLNELSPPTQRDEFRLLRI